MKKIILLFLSLFIFVSYADAQSGTVRRIVDAIEGSDGTCYTTDGERGTLLPNSSSRRTESTSSYSSSRTRAIQLLAHQFPLQQKSEPGPLVLL